MDIHMPVMDGFEATRRIMETVPTPIVIVSGSTGATEVASTFRAIEAGALAVVRRPPGIKHEEFERASKELIQTVKLMSEIKVVRRIPRAVQKPFAALSPTSVPLLQSAAKIQAVAIGASTGGPPVLQIILSGLPKGFPVPVFIVQHIAQGFTKGFVEWLAGASGFPVSVASHAEYAKPGHAYVAPNGFHMGVGNGLQIELSDQAPRNGMRPSVDYLFHTVAQTFGQSAVGILLSGMGRDGAAELKTMKEKGGVTIAQNEESSVVYGMPGEAIKLGAATYVLSPEVIATTLANLLK
jgi:two-component system chemotaxis response regulator CheB